MSQHRMALLVYTVCVTLAWYPAPKVGVALLGAAATAMVWGLTVIGWDLFDL